MRAIDERGAVVRATPPSDAPHAARGRPTATAHVPRLASQRSSPPTTHGLPRRCAPGASVRHQAATPRRSRRSIERAHRAEPKRRTLRSASRATAARSRHAIVCARPSRALDHVVAIKRDDLRRQSDFGAGALGLERHGRHADQNRAALDFDRFARNNALLRNDVVIGRNTAILRIVLGTAAENIAAADPKIRRVIDQRRGLRRRPPTGAFDGIGQRGKDPRGIRRACAPKNERGRA